MNLPKKGLKSTDEIRRKLREAMLERLTQTNQFCDDLYSEKFGESNMQKRF
jgi:hypothetical protein